MNITKFETGKEFQSNIQQFHIQVLRAIKYLFKFEINPLLDL